MLLTINHTITPTAQLWAQGPHMLIQLRPFTPSRPLVSLL